MKTPMQLSSELAQLVVMMSWSLLPFRHACAKWPLFGGCLQVCARSGRVESFKKIVATRWRRRHHAAHASGERMQADYAGCPEVTQLCVLMWSSLFTMLHKLGGISCTKAACSQSSPKRKLRLVINKETVNNYLARVAASDVPYKN